MKARIRNFWIRDRLFEHYFPDDLEYFGAFVDMRIGPDGEDGADDFELMVCSPSWFEQNILKPPKTHESHEQVFRHAFGRHYLFFVSYDEEKVRTAIFDLVEQQSADSWGELALRLSRHFQWEYEDYVDSIALQ